MNSEKNYKQKLKCEHKHTKSYNKFVRGEQIDEKVIRAQQEITGIGKRYRSSIKKVNKKLSELNKKVHKWQRASCFSAGVGPNMAPRQDKNKQ